jgi:hypothetical protein
MPSVLTHRLIHGTEKPVAGREDCQSAGSRIQIALPTRHLAENPFSLNKYDSRVFIHLLKPGRFRLAPHLLAAFRNASCRILGKDIHFFPTTSRGDNFAVDANSKTAVIVDSSSQPSEL